MRPPDRVHLELVSESEAVHFVAASFDESVYEELSSSPPRKVEDLKAQLASFRDGRLPGDQLHWAIRDRLANDCLGSLQVNLKSHRTVEIGYRVRSQYQNQGIATEALGQLLIELLGFLPGYQVIALVHPDNLASVKVLLKANFIAVSSKAKVSGIATQSRNLFRYVPPGNGAA